MRTTASPLAPTEQALARVLGLRPQGWLTTSMSHILPKGPTGRLVLGRFTARNTLTGEVIYHPYNFDPEETPDAYSSELLKLVSTLEARQ